MTTARLATTRHSTNISAWPEAENGAPAIFSSPTTEETTIFCASTERSATVRVKDGAAARITVIASSVLKTIPSCARIRPRADIHRPIAANPRRTRVPLTVAFVNATRINAHHLRYHQMSYQAPTMVASKVFDCQRRRTRRARSRGTSLSLSRSLTLLYVRTNALRRASERTISAPGYQANDGLIACDGNDGDPPSRYLTCISNKCDSISFPPYVVEASNADTCSNGQRLDAHGVSTCTVSCAPGYQGRDGTFTCSSIANDGDDAQLSILCTEVTCNPYTFPTGVVPGNVNPCVNLIELSTHSNNQCRVKCDEGYTGLSTTVTCESNAEFGDEATSTISCSENSCLAYTLEDNVVGSSAAGCVDGVVLRSRSPSVCFVDCADGYHGIGGNVTCPRDATNGDAPDVNVECVESECSSISLPFQHLVGRTGSNDACTHGMVLSSHTKTTCAVQCAAGWMGNDGNILCPPDANPGDAVSATTSCTQVQCNPYALPGDVVPSGRTDECAQNVALLSGESCTVACSAGYTAGTYEISCASNATVGNDVTSNARCEEISCPPIAFRVGEISNECTNGDVLTSVTNAVCELSCDVGYTPLGNGTMTCNVNGDLVREESFECLEHQCAPFRFGADEVAHDENVASCSENLVLYTHSNPTRCYFRTVSTNVSMVAKCAPNSLNGSSLVRQLDDSNEVKCLSYTIDNSMYLPGDVDPCYNGIELSSVNDPACTLACAAGWTGQQGFLSCTEASRDTLIPISSLNCTENRCLVPSLDDLSVVATQTCYPNKTLSTRTETSCDVSCASGYFGSSGGRFDCPPNAEDGTIAVLTSSCVEISCAEFEFTNGEIADGTSTSCYSGIILQSVTNTTCTFACDEGFSGTSSEMRCPSNAAFGALPVLSSGSGCTQNRCAPYHHQVGTSRTSGQGGCMDGVALLSSAMCEITCLPGFSSTTFSSSGTVVCPSNASEGSQTMTSFECEENLCAPLQIPSDMVADLSDNETCVDGLRLGTSTSTSCTLKCASGYSGTGGQFTCLGTSESNDMAQLDSSCIEVKCVQLTFGDGVEGDPSGADACIDGIQLTTYSDPSCDLRCMKGYSGNTSTALCPSDAVFGTFPVVGITCSENVCRAYNFREGVVEGESSSNATACFNGIQLSSHTMSECSIRCADGYSDGYGFVRCPSDAENFDDALEQISCEVNSCDGISFPTGVVGGGNNPCVESLRLYTHNDTIGMMTSCDAICDEGYFGLPGVFTCDEDAENNTLPTWSGNCIEVFCNPYEFPEGVIGGVWSPSVPNCVDDVILKTHTQPRCSVQCAMGYTGAESVVSCAPDATFGTAALSTIECIENSCAAYTLVNGVVGASGDDGCVNNIVLTTHSQNSCNVECAVGFSGLAGAVMCSSSASNGDSVESDVTCTENICKPLDVDPNTITTNTRGDECEMTPTVVLSTRTDSTCTLNSSTLGILTVRCPPDALNNSEVIVEPGVPTIRCLPFDWDDSVVGDVFDPCVRSDFMDIGEDCRLKCAPGFSGPSMVVSCSPSASPWDPPVVQTDDGRMGNQCVENRCASLTFEDGVVSDVFSPFACTSSEASLLGTHTNSNCTVRCDEGYTGEPTHYVCSADADDGAEATLYPPLSSCTENKCSALALRDGIVPAETAEACENREYLSSHSRSTCEVKCSSGYLSSSSVYRCAEDANEGDAASTDLECVLAVESIETTCGEGTQGCAQDDEARSPLRCGDDVGVSTTRLATEGGDVLLVRNFTGDEGHYVVVLSDGDTQLTSNASYCDLDATSRVLRCPLPEGIGIDKSVQLFRKNDLSDQMLDTYILDGCSVTYAEPIVTFVEGCHSSSCSREGGDEITIHGSNFGFSNALVFVNGEVCQDTTHGEINVECDAQTSQNRSSCHRTIRCTLPALRNQQTVNTLLVMQSNQYGAFYNFSYAPCDSGFRQVEGDCVKCAPGRFSRSTDSLICESCAPGRYASSEGLSECLACPLNTFAEDSGSIACMQCPGGQKADEGEPTCEDCMFIYWMSSGHCGAPVFGILCVILALVIMAVAGYRVRKKITSVERKRKKLLEDMDTKHEETKVTENAIMQLEESWRFDWNQITIHKKIGEGGGGAVYKASIKSRRGDYVVKELNDVGDRDVSSEVKFMQRARHPRLVAFWGFGIKPNGTHFLIVEFMAEGDMLQRMVESREANKPMTWNTRIRLLKDVCEGMAYIHDKLQSIHRDLKSENVFLHRVQHKLRGKVADFGLSRFVTTKPVDDSPKLSEDSSLRSGSRKLFASVLRKVSTPSIGSPMASNRSMHSFASDGRMDSSAESTFDPTSMTSAIGTAAYMAPEICVKGFFKNEKYDYSRSVDVYAFGVIMWETMELDRAWKNETFGSAIQAKTERGERPTIRAEWPESGILERPPKMYVEIMRDSWDQNPNARPTFANLRTAFDGIGSFIGPSHSSKVAEMFDIDDEL